MEKPESLADLLPAPYNPRRIRAKALAGLTESLARFGDISGLVWNRTMGHLVCGHQRLEALKRRHGEALRFEEGAVVTPDGERFSVRVVEWDEATEKAANLSANNQWIAGEWDSGEILALLDTLDMFSFQGLELDSLLESFDAFDVKEAAPPILESGEKGEIETMVFSLHRHQAEKVREALKKAQKGGGAKSDLSENRSGNALYYICARFLNG